MAGQIVKHSCCFHIFMWLYLTLLLVSRITLLLNDSITRCHEASVSPCLNLGLSVHFVEDHHVSPNISWCTHQTSPLQSCGCYTGCCLPVNLLPGIRSLHISSSMHRTGNVLLWARPYNSSPYRPRTSPEYDTVAFAVLLLSAGDIETNPGPTANSTSSIRFGYININSAVNKAALIHDTISSFSVDLLALSETRISHSTPNAIKSDIAPAGFSVMHVHRNPAAIHPSGGGLALICRNEITIKPHPLAATLCPTSFELQLVRITSMKPSITVVNAYRPPSLSVAQFHDELADVLMSISASTVDRLLLCGDLNSPGPDAVCQL